LNDANNEDNKNNKTILAGNSDDIFSIDVESINESLDVQDVTFVLTGATATDIK